MNAQIIDRMRDIPGYRGLIQPIEEAAGPLLLLRDLLEEEPLDRVMQLLDLGLALYAAGDALFVIRGDLMIYRDMLTSIVNCAEGEEDDEDDHESENSTAERPIAAAA